MTKEEVYRKQMEKLGIYDPIFDPEIKTLARIEREYTRAQKAWSKTAPPGGKPSFLDDHFPIIQKLRAEILQHREALGLTPKALRKLTGAAITDAPDQKDLISAKLDRIAESVTGEVPADWWKQARDLPAQVIPADPYAGIAAELRTAVAEDMG